jgi:hypothetical protein
VQIGGHNREQHQSCAPETFGGITVAVRGKPGSRPYRDQLRRTLVAAGIGGPQLVSQVAVDLARCGMRPRQAWRYAAELSQTQAATRFNEITGNPRAPMRGNRIGDYEKWPDGGVRPPVRALKILAEAYGTTWDQLVDARDLACMPDTDKIAYADMADASRLARQAAGSPIRHDPAGSPAIVLTRREFLAEAGTLTAAAAPAPFTAAPQPRAVAPWAAIHHAILDPTAVMRQIASQPGGDPVGAPGILRDLSQARTAVIGASLMSDYGSLAQLLPRLIGLAELAGLHAPDGEQQAEASAILSDLYAVASWTMIKADDPGTAWIAATRAMNSATAAGDCLRASAATRCLAEVHMRAGNLEEAGRVALLATAHLDAAPEADRRQVLCLRGAAMLSAAAAGARRGDAYEAYTALKAAAAYADQAREDLVTLGTMFGPGNVAIHRVVIPLELGRPNDAVRNIPAGPLPLQARLAERRARFLIDVARSHARGGAPRAAEDALAEAELAAPDEVRHHRLTRELLHDLLPRSGRTSKIRALASRCPFQD